jgi:hypothetical protein
VAVPTVESFADFAGLLLAAREGAPDLAARARALAATPAAAEMARRAEEIARHFTHPGRARDDAIALFFQAAPFAFADPAVVAGGDPAAVAERLIAAVRASGLGPDFRRTVLAEPLFRLVALDGLSAMAG